MKVLSENSVVITGNQRGLGRLITLDLEKDYPVLGTSRHPRNPHVDYLDFDSEESIWKFTFQFRNAYPNPKIVLIQNIGVGCVGNFIHIDELDFKKVFQTNLFGPLLLIKAFIRSMEHKGLDFKIIIISSNASEINKYKHLSVYGGAKSALEHAITGAIKEYKDVFHILRPGPIKFPSFMEEPTIIKTKEPAARIPDYTKDFKWEEPEPIIKEIRDIVTAFFS